MAAIKIRNYPAGSSCKRELNSASYGLGKYPPSLKRLTLFTIPYPHNSLLFLILLILLEPHLRRRPASEVPAHRAVGVLVVGVDVHPI